MFVPLEIAKNLGILLPPVRSAAQRRHHTGLDVNQAGIGRAYAKLRAHFEPSGKNVLDVGPGQTFDLLTRAVAEGARSATAIDVADYGHAPASVRLVLYDGASMPLPSASVDVAWSNACFEHVRYPDQLVAECARVLRPGGLLLCQIDLRDHYNIEGERAADHLRYPGWLWKAMTWNRSAYTNRLRLSDWRTLFAQHGFDVAHIETEESPALRTAYRRGNGLSRFSEEDVVTIGAFLVLTRS